MQHGFIKVATATPRIRVGDSAHNAAACAALATEACESGVKLLVFPELCLTGATCADLFYHDRLINGALDALRVFLAETAACDTLCVVGLPVRHADKLYDCAAVCHRGMLLGLVPKTHVPSAELRWFTPAPDRNLTYELDGGFVNFGTKQIFVSTTVPDLRVGVEIGSDATVAVTPSCALSAAGATVICQPTASPEVVGARKNRRHLTTSLSARIKSAYLSANCGDGESTTDLVFSGNSLIAEDGHILSERPAFVAEPLCITEIDVSRLAFDRRRENTFSTAGAGEYTENYFDSDECETELTRFVDPHPFVPADPAERAERCELILSIQAAGLARRIEAAWAKKIVVGISGGLDSCLALLVMVRAMDRLERPRTDIIAVTMPCFGTTVRTKTNATVLCDELGVDFRTVDIFDAVNQHFADIGHDPQNRNVVYENAQARERTQVLMDIANAEGGMVVGTGDLSELVLGWATYNGDHMSMYGVNGGVPKTLVRHVVSHCADREAELGHTALADAVRDIVNTPVSPELLPADESGDIAQKTEDLVGPYELHDFYLYHLLRYGCTPAKLFRLARYALAPFGYDDTTLLHWLEVFTRRFFSQQFKRSCLPDGPKIGSVGVSPRGDLHMPSDASSALWMEELRELRETYLS